jgi:inhibitor of KinA
MDDEYPHIRCVADTGILVEFGGGIDPIVHDRVLNLDLILSAHPFKGLTSLTPTFASLLIGIDPCMTTPGAAIAFIRNISASSATPLHSPRVFEIPVCYEMPYASDLAHVAEVTGQTLDTVVAAHLSATCRVYMYGFAPGFAYLASLPPEIQLPRRAAPVRGVPAGSVNIAGPQCIVTTIDMPTGWWTIGRSPTAIFRPFDSEPFLFKIGDTVRFVEISKEKLETMMSQRG